MDKDPSTSIDRRTPQEVLAEAIVNPTYDSYAFGEDGRFQPLTEGMIDETTKNSTEFQTIRDLIGMPTMEEDSNVTPPFTYADSDEFIQALFASEEVASQYDDAGRFSEADLLRKKNLNNLNARLMAAPATLTNEGVKQKSEDESMNDMFYGITPALIRAYAVAPELMSSVRYVLQDAGTVRDRIELFKENDSVVVGVYMAYRIMGRLVKVDDNFREAYVQGRPNIGPKEDFSPVTSAHQVVTR